MKKDFWTEWGGKSPWMEIKHEALWFFCKLVCCMALQNLYFSASCSYRFECEQQKKNRMFWPRTLFSSSTWVASLVVVVSIFSDFLIPGKRESRKWPFPGISREIPGFPAPLSREFGKKAWKSGNSREIPVPGIPADTTSHKGPLAEK